MIYACPHSHSSKWIWRNCTKTFSCLCPIWEQSHFICSLNWNYSMNQSDIHWAFDKWMINLSRSFCKTWWRDFHAFFKVQIKCTRWRLQVTAPFRRVILFAKDSYFHTFNKLFTFYLGFEFSWAYPNVRQTFWKPARLTNRLPAQLSLCWPLM